MAFMKCMQAILGCSTLAALLLFTLSGLLFFKQPIYERGISGTSLLKEQIWSSLSLSLTVVQRSSSLLLLCPRINPAIFSLWPSSSSSQTLNLTFVFSLYDPSPTNHGCPYLATPLSSGPHSHHPNHLPLSHAKTPPQIRTLISTPNFHKMTSLQSLTYSPTRASPPVRPSRVHWIGPELTRVRVCYKLYSTTLIRLPNCCTRCLFGLRSDQGSDALRRSSPP